MYANYEQYENFVQPCPYLKGIEPSSYVVEGCGIGGLSNTKTEEAEKDGISSRALSCYKGCAQLFSISTPLLVNHENRGKTDWRRLFCLEEDLQRLTEEVTSYTSFVDSLSLFEMPDNCPHVDVELEGALCILESQLDRIHAGCQQLAPEYIYFLDNETLQKAVESASSVLACRDLVFAGDSIIKLFAGILNCRGLSACNAEAMKRAEETAILLDGIEKSVDSLESLVEQLVAATGDSLECLKSDLGSLLQ